MPPDQRPELLRIENLHAWYGESHVLQGMNLMLREGEVITLLGRNGSGRTTTLKAILGLVSKRTGSIRVHGTEIINLPTHKIAHVGKLGYCPEERGIFASLNVDENLELPPIVAKGGLSNQPPMHETPGSLTLIVRQHHGPTSYRTRDRVRWP